MVAEGFVQPLVDIIATHEVSVSKHCRLVDRLQEALGLRPDSLALPISKSTAARGIARFECSVLYESRCHFD